MEKSHVSLLKSICPACGIAYDDGILLDRRMKNTLERETVMMGDLCAKCKQQIADDRIILVVINRKETELVAKDRESPTPKEVYRTGEVMYMKSKTYTDVFNASIPPKKFCWIDEETAKALKSMISPPKEEKKPS